MLTGTIIICRMTISSVIPAHTLFYLFIGPGRQPQPWFQDSEHRPSPSLKPLYTDKAEPSQNLMRATRQKIHPANGWHPKKHQQVCPEPFALIILWIYTEGWGYRSAWAALLSCRRAISEILNPRFDWLTQKLTGSWIILIQCSTHANKLVCLPWK